MAARPATDFALFSRIGGLTLGICDGLSTEQWEAPSTCAGWQVKHLIAHQAAGTTYSGPRMLGYLIKCGSTTKAGHQMAIDMAQECTREQILQAFAKGHGSSPANLYARLVSIDVGILDAAIHLQDLRRSVHDEGEIPTEIAEVLFDLIPVTKGPVSTKAKIAGLQLHATDLDRRLGDGPLVEGKLEALMMAAGGRREALSELSGPGVALLAERIGAV
ncbi:MAG: maleylpyruvate isomerase family mycothiol-dependent enzyme [Actinomycetota bacterium]|nr:maleylpyruvate isomerase family mycothiol-dependent enzyme [Actinomycetota bacterium]